MKKLTHGLAILLIALATTAVTAQTATRSRVQQSATSPAQRVIPPTSTVVSPVATAVQQQKYVVADKATIPANLFGMEDRAIIIVGGKPVAAGDVKRELQFELRQQSVPQSKIVRRVPQPAQVRDIPGGIGANIRPLPKPTDHIDVASHTPSVGGYAGVRDTARASAGLSYTELLNYCKTHPAEISRVRGTITPNNRFTIDGNCFGDTTGAVEAIGMFPGGNLRLVFERWSDSQITAFVPAVSGAPDHTIALTVVRPDKGRSPAVQARFYATRQQVVVPPRYWSPNPDFVDIQVDQGGGNIFSSYTVWGAGAASRVTPFSLQINPNCELDSAAANSNTGRVEAINWDSPSSANQANVEVVWTPRCVTQTTNYVVASSSQRICSVGFTLSAWAQCPVGLTP